MEHHASEAAFEQTSKRLFPSDFIHSMHHVLVFELVCVGADAASLKLESQLCQVQWVCDEACETSCGPATGHTLQESQLLNLVISDFAITVLNEIDVDSEGSEELVKSEVQPAEWSKGGHCRPIASVDAPESFLFEDLSDSVPI